ncbi:MAG TPA: PilZ domain-containing protein [Allosphingosinicella sp.]|nr:PilZ domain-containing protein [Allosphingosinicella sp.]
MAITARKPAQIGTASLADCLDRRTGPRFHTVLRVARVTRAHDVGLWRLRNISDSGMMLETGVPVKPGEHVSIQLSESITIEGRIAWEDGSRCGVAFDAPIDCAATLETLVTEQSRPDYRPLRVPVQTRAIAYCERGMHTVKVLDLSPHGAGIAHDGCFKPGMSTLLLFENGEEHRGVIRWSKDGRAGVLLLQPFPCATLESASRL